VSWWSPTAVRRVPAAALALSVAQQTGSLPDLGATMWGDWEDWFIDIAESHTSLTILNFYRSPDPANHWISTARPSSTWPLRMQWWTTEPVGPHITIRSGVVALRTLADHFHILYPPDPAPDDPISIRDPSSTPRSRMEASGCPSARTGTRRGGTSPAGG
jgi:hypothetical protein